MVYEKCGFMHVRSYIQSGNVLFDTDSLDFPRQKRILEEAVLSHFGFDVVVVMRSAAQFRALLSTNPFLIHREMDQKKLYVTFFDSGPDESLVHKLDNGPFLPDTFYVSGEQAFVYCPNGYGRTKINNHYFEKMLQVRATTRNWNTVNKLLKLSES